MNSLNVKVIEVMVYVSQFKNFDISNLRKNVKFFKKFKCFEKVVKNSVTLIDHFTLELVSLTCQNGR